MAGPNLSKEALARNAERMRELWTQPEFRAKMTAAFAKRGESWRANVRAHTTSDRMRAVVGANTRRRWQEDPSYKSMMQLSNEKKWTDPARRERTIRGLLRGAKRRWDNMSPEEREIHVSRVSKFWVNLSQEERDAQIRKIRFSAGVKPNKLEARVAGALDAVFPGEWRYNAGDFVIAGRVPDFVNVNGRKAVLEVFGDYWHRGEDPADKIAQYAAVGYACTVIWEKDVPRAQARLRALLGSLLNPAPCAAPAADA